MTFPTLFGLISSVILSEIQKKVVPSISTINMFTTIGRKSKTLPENYFRIQVEK